MRRSPVSRSGPSGHGPAASPWRWPALSRLLVCLLIPGASLAAGDGDWVLRGTVVLEAHSGYAIVERVGRSGQVWRRTGHEIRPGLRLSAVFSDHAVVTSGGRQRRIDFGGRITEAPSEGGPYTIDPARVAEIVTAVDIIPHQSHGRIDGYYANGVPRSLRDEIGLRPGDILRRVNGRRLDGDLDPSLLPTLLEGDRIELEVQRQGRLVDLVYRIGTSAHGPDP